MKTFARALGLILALLPTYLIRFDIIGIPTTLLEVMVGLFLVSVVIYTLTSDTRMREAWGRVKNLGATNWAIGIFILGATISTIISPEPVRAVGQLKAFFFEPILLFYAIIILFKNSAALKIPVRMMFWSTVAISAFGIIQYYTHLYLPLRFWGNGEEVKRITSVFEYPNALALYLAPLFIFFLALIIKKWLVVKMPTAIIGLGIITSAILLTYSRGAWLGVLAALGILILRQSGLSLKRSAPILALIVLALSPVFISRFKLTFQDSSSSERMSLYKVAADKLVSNPLLGNGLYGFRTTLTNSDYSGEILNYPHNVILNFWVETGFLGILGFAFLIWLSLARYRKNPSSIKLAGALFLLAFLVHGLFDAPYFKNDLSILFWTALSLFYIPEE